jgi:hypothetical protein
MATHEEAPAMNDRDERIGKNEILLREVNERIEQVNLRATEVRRFGFICECGDSTCAERVQLELKEYEAVRTDPRHFLTVPGHETPDLERVVERHERYQVVEKDKGEPADLAVETDPR